MGNHASGESHIETPVDSSKTSSKFAVKSKLKIKTGPNSRKTPAKPTRSFSYPEVTQRGLELTPLQINCVKKAWKQARGTTRFEPAATIFLRVFFISPEIGEIFQRRFDYGRDIAGRNQHLTQFTSLMDTVIRNIDDENGFVPMLRDVGGHHYSKQVEIRPEFWNTFARALIDCSVEWGGKRERNSESQVAWNKIAMFIVDKLKGP